MQPVIVNADDLGLTVDVNEGIFEALDAGLISDASLMAVGEAFDHAVAGLTHRRRRSIGLHVCLVDGERPVAPDPELDPLLRQGRFMGRNSLFMRLIRSRRRMLRAMEQEVDAQFARVLATGLRISHVDSHQHAHLFPGVAEMIIRACRRHEIRFVRAPLTRVRSHQSGGVALLSRRFRRLAFAGGLSPMSSLGFEHSGRMTSDAFRRYVRRAGIIGAEVMVHPGRGRSETSPKYRHWHYDWDRELRAIREGALGATVGAISYDSLHASFS